MPRNSRAVSAGAEVRRRARCAGPGRRRRRSSPLPLFLSDPSAVIRARTISAQLRFCWNWAASQSSNWGAGGRRSGPRPAVIASRQKAPSGGHSRRCRAACRSTGPLIVVVVGEELLDLRGRRGAARSGRGRSGGGTARRPSRARARFCRPGTLFPAAGRSRRGPAASSGYRARRRSSGTLREGPGHTFFGAGPSPCRRCLLLRRGPRIGQRTAPRAKIAPAASRRSRWHAIAVLMESLRRIPY